MLDSTTRNDRGSGPARLGFLACLLLAIAIPVLALAAFVIEWPQRVVGALQPIGAAAATFGSLGIALQIAVVGLLLVPAIVMGLCLAEAAWCLKSLRGPGALSAGTVRRLRRFSALMLASVGAGLVVQPLAGVIVSLAGTGKGTLSLGMSSHQAILLVFAAVTWQITRTMEAAIEVAAEYAQIV